MFEPYTFQKSQITCRGGEIVDTLRSGRSGRKLVGVQVSLAAPWIYETGELLVLRLEKYSP